MGDTAAATLETYKALPASDHPYTDYDFAIIAEILDLAERQALDAARRNKGAHAPMRLAQHTRLSTAGQWGAQGGPLTPSTQSAMQSCAQHMCMQALLVAPPSAQQRRHTSTMHRPWQTLPVCSCKKSTWILQVSCRHWGGDPPEATQSLRAGATPPWGEARGGHLLLQVSSCCTMHGMVLVLSERWSRSCAKSCAKRYTPTNTPPPALVHTHVTHARARTHTHTHTTGSS